MNQFSERQTQFSGASIKNVTLLDKTDELKTVLLKTFNLIKQFK